MRTTAFFIILLTGFSFLAAQNAPEDYVNSFFTLIGQQKYAEAVEKLPANKLLKEDTSFNSKLIAKLRVASQKTGEYCGYELIQKEEVSPSFMLLTYYIKYLYTPQKIQFTFYKPKDSWQLMQVNLSIQNRPAATGRKQISKH
jgi:hypothetical protein